MYRHYMRARLQIGLYRVWCKLRRQEYHTSSYDHPFEPGAYHITKAVPAFGISLFGRTLWITTAMPLSCKRVERQGRAGDPEPKQ